MARIGLRQRANRLFKHRELHVYGVGLAKTGTHYLASMFNDHYRVAHEHEWAKSIEFAEQVESGAVREDCARKYLRERDRQWGLDVDVSHLNIFIVQYLVAEFPKAKFILTIRDCYSWLESIVNHQLTRPFAGHARRWANFAFGKSNFDHPPEEFLLKDAGLFCIDAYLHYWSAFTWRILDNVPSSHLLVIRTSDLGASASSISKFIAVPEKTINVRNALRYKARKKHDILARIPADYLHAKFTHHCKDLMEILFPQDCAPGS